MGSQTAKLREILRRSGIHEEIQNPFQSTSEMLEGSTPRWTYEDEEAMAFDDVMAPRKQFAISMGNTSNYMGQVPMELVVCDSNAINVLPLLSINDQQHVSNYLESRSRSVSPTREESDFEE